MPFKTEKTIFVVLLANLLCYLVYVIRKESLVVVPVTQGLTPELFRLLLI